MSARSVRRAGRTIDLQVCRGETFALLGANGAGKTTTLEVIEGFHSRTSGTVRVLGVDPATSSAEVRRATGIMLQEGGFFAELTVDETLCCGGGSWTAPMTSTGCWRALTSPTAATCQQASSPVASGAGWT